MLQNFLIDKGKFTKGNFPCSFSVPIAMLAGGFRISLSELAFGRYVKAQFT